MRTPAAFSARFAVAGLGTIAFDFADARNFAFAPERGWGSTRVVDGRIHLVLTPSLATAGVERVLRVGTLRNAPAPTPSRPPTLRQARTVDASAWGLDAAPQETRVDAPLAPTLTVAALAPLAVAQHVVDARMRPGMDMALCGDAVGRLVASWPAAVTVHGLAVLASTSGVRMSGPLRPLRAPPALPRDVAVEDLRFESAR